MFLLFTGSSGSGTIADEEHKSLDENIICEQSHFDTNNKKHVCGYCNKTFSTSGSLKNHIRTHTGKKQFECEQCKKTISHPCTLKKHIRTHTGEKPFECKYCQKKFSRSDQLKNHIPTHTGEKPFICEYCKKKFAFSDKLNYDKHVQAHIELIEKYPVEF